MYTYIQETGEIKALFSGSKGKCLSTPEAPYEKQLCCLRIPSGSLLAA